MTKWLRITYSCEPKRYLYNLGFVRHDLALSWEKSRKSESNHLVVVSFIVYSIVVDVVENEMRVCVCSLVGWVLIDFEC